MDIGILEMIECTAFSCAILLIACIIANEGLERSRGGYVYKRPAPKQKPPEVKKNEH
jgi:hypothetical protein